MNRAFSAEGLIYPMNPWGDAPGLTMKSTVGANQNPTPKDFRGELFLEEEQRVPLKFQIF
jgi:hypothetical protein